MPSSIHPAVLSALAPTGRLRASINLGNPILARADAVSQASGVSVDLARAFAEHCGLPIDLVVFDAAGKSVDAVVREQADFGFFAIDPVRGTDIHFTEPYVLIEGSYLVREASLFQANEEVDRASTTVVVGNGSAYDLYLTREIKAATLVRAPTSPLVVDTFIQTGSDVAAGVKQQLEADAMRLPGLRLLPGRFMMIQQAMGLPKTRGLPAAELLRGFVEESKRSGFIAAALTRHGIKGASLA
jgi:polar amino acid transport system substrate-binding protein